MEILKQILHLLVVGFGKNAVIYKFKFKINENLLITSNASGLQSSRISPCLTETSPVL